METKQSFRERCLVFSVGVAKTIEVLPRTATGKHVADQLLRSGTSIGANVHEARGAESRADFIHKMQLALKETRETYYWLGFIERTELSKQATLPALLKECDEIAAILARSVLTAKQNGQ